MEDLSFKDYFQIYIKSGAPIISIVTNEVDRATSHLKSITNEINTSLQDKKDVDDFLKEHGYNFFVWDMIKGFSDGKNTISNTTNANKALDHICHKDTAPGIFVFQNFHLVWETNKPRYIQIFRDVAEHAKYNNKNIILIGCENKIPNELKDIIVNLSFSLPTISELKKYIKEYSKNHELKLSEKKLDEISNASLGLTMNELDTALYVSYVLNKGKDIDKKIIFREKSNKIKHTGFLEYIKSDRSIEHIGGMGALKEGAEDVAYVMNNLNKALDYGIKMPKGLLLIGLAGSGKTLFAKAISNILGLPLYRSDLGRVFGSRVGQSEGQTRELISLMDSLAPCIIMWDEMEKMFSGMEGSGHTDGGVTSRLTSDLLYWLNEKKTQVYVVGTINNVDMGLSSAHIRAGRFDSTFFVDAPSEEARKQIFKIHLKLAKKEVKNYDIDELAKISNDYTGAEIEEAIHTGMKKSFRQNRMLTNDDVKWGLTRVTPIVQLKPKETEALRKWAKQSGAINADVIENNKEVEAWNDDKKPRKAYV